MGEKIIRFDVEQHFSWKAVIQDVETLIDDVGEDTLASLVTMQFGADRLSLLLTQMGRLIEEEDTPRTSCDRINTWLLICGTINELAKRIDKIRRSQVNLQLISIAQWNEIVGIADNWKNNENIKRIRNKTAFHFDQDLIKQGLLELRNREGEIVIEAGATEKILEGRFVLGQDAVLAGIGMSLEDSTRLIKTVVDDHTRLIEILHQLFVEVMQSNGWEGVKNVVSDDQVGV